MQALYIANYDHYMQVIQKVNSVKRQLWIGTADIKDLYVMQGTKAVPFVGALSDLIQNKLSKLA